MKKQIASLFLGAAAGAVLLVACGNDGSGNTAPGTTYSAVSNSFGGDLTANVTVHEGEITAITFDHEDTPSFAYPLLDDLTEAILAAGNTSVTVDSMAGSTVTADAAISAINEALTQAGLGNLATGGSTAAGNEETAVAGFAPTATISVGVTSASLSQSIRVPGFIDDIEVTVFIENEQLVGIQIDHSETDYFVDPVFGPILNEILETGSYHQIGIDMMAGGTVSGQALITAMNFLSQIVNWE
ncbi:MAG: FMN-binding protein [Defluviitaleaceae bacterium]|nr:FMN-binding protein [Defluviitaleaceae bacterium]